MKRGKVISFNTDPKHVRAQEIIRTGKDVLEIDAGVAKLLLKKANTKNITVTLEGDYKGEVEPKIKIVDQHGKVRIFLECFEHTADLSLLVVIPNRRYKSVRVTTRSKGNVHVEGGKAKALNVLTVAGNVTVDGSDSYQQLQVETVTGDVKVSGWIRKEGCITTIKTQRGDVDVQFQNVSELDWTKNGKQDLQRRSGEGVKTLLETTNNLGEVKVALL